MKLSDRLPAVLSILLLTSMFKKFLNWIIALLMILALGKNAYALPGGTWGLLFADEFSGSSVDTRKWTTQFPWGGVHNSDSYAIPSNLSVANGILTQTATRESCNGYDFSSAAMSTGYDKFTFKYGYAEARVKLPTKLGSWPAFWGLYTGWPPESDIMEFPCFTSGENYQDYNIAYHYDTTPGVPGGDAAYGSGLTDPGSAGNLTYEYHIFGMEWTSGDIKYYFDGNWMCQVYDDSAIAQMQYMYLLLDYSVGGWAGKPSTSQWASDASDTFQVDWVRVWQQTSNTVSNWTHDGDGNFNWDTSAYWSNGNPRLSRHTAHFGNVNATNVHLDWNDLKTVGGIEVEGPVNYNIGWSDDSLMLHNSRDTRTYIDLLAGPAEGTNAISSRLELYQDVTIRNYMSTIFSLNGNIIGAKELRMESGKVVINGEGQYSGNTIVTNYADVTVTNSIYNCDATTTGSVQISNGGILRVNNLDWGGSLKWLYYNSNRLYFDNGTLVVGQNSTSNRGFTIQSGGAKIVIAPGATVAINEGLSYESIVSSAGGNLTFDCQGTAALGKVLPGTGKLIKSGTGTLTLNALNTYSGDTTVNGGTLEIAGGIGASGTSLIDVQSGKAVLKTVNVSKENLDVTTAVSATFEVFDGTHDVDLIDGGGITQVDSGATLTASSIHQNTLTIGSGAKVVIRPLPGGPLSGTITPVPEPSVFILMAGAAVLLALRRIGKRM
jgi:autotransporter-associated beta strand protein